MSLISQIQNSTSPLILDGPTGTELSRRGFDVNRPGWSALAIEKAPELLEEIHRDYLQAGAQLLTANTFRTDPINVSKWTDQSRARELTLKAVQIVRSIASSNEAILGSIAPIHDCYQASTAPLSDEQQRAIREHVSHLAEAEVDAFLIETQTTILELTYILQQCVQYDIPRIVSLVTFDGENMLDGMHLSQAAETAESNGACAVGCNCLSAELVPTALQSLNSTILPKIIYANSGYMNADGNWIESLGADVDQHVREAERWIEQGVRILGGCCGTDIALIAKFSERFGSRSHRA